MAEFTQAYGIINDMAKQATGTTSLVAVDTSSFVSVATTLLKTGYDNYMNALSNVLIDSFFAWRAYNGQFGIITTDEKRFGNHIRKISPLDDVAVEAVQYSLTNGESVDQWTVRKPNVVQFNYYDKDVWDRWISLPKHQIDGSVRSEREFSEFVAMVIGNLRNQITQDRETTARLTFNNFVMGVVQDELYNPNGRVVKLLTEYNTLTGQSLTKEDIFLPANYNAFIQWASAKISTCSNHLTERGYRYHKNITGKNIPRFTPKEYQKFVLMSDFYELIKASSFSNTFHEQYIKGFNGFESINFLQSSEEGKRDKIELSSFATLADDGTIFTATEGDYKVEDFVGAIFDRDAMLMTTVNYWTQNTGMNARGGYENLWYHYTNRYCNDFTENAIIFLLA